MVKVEKPDIQNEADIKTFVDDFYNRVSPDPLLGPIFNEIAAVDWDHHLPTMYSFWSAMLLGAKGYHGAPFPKHAALRTHISPAHFARWIELFTATIDTHFQGPTADTAKQRALNIAFIFQSKLGMLAGAEQIRI
jgi:hemoglobin